MSKQICVTQLLNFLTIDSFFYYAYRTEIKTTTTKTSKIQFSKNPLTAVFCPNCFNMFYLHFVKKHHECVNEAIALFLELVIGLYSASVQYLHNKKAQSSLWMTDIFKQNTVKTMHVAITPKFNGVKHLWSYY